MAYVYILKCVDGSYYIGAAKIFELRLKNHCLGRVQYTKSRLPVKPIFIKEFDTFKEALIFEKKVKSWKKRKSIEKMLNKKDNIVDKFSTLGRRNSRL